MQVMVFFSSCNSVKYHAELLNYIDIPVKDIHGKQKQQRRTSTFFEFNQAEKGVLLCTDVAARGLDIPAGGLDSPLLSLLPVGAADRAVNQRAGGGVAALPYVRVPHCCTPVGIAARLACLPRSPVNLFKDFACNPLSVRASAPSACG